MPDPTVQDPDDVLAVLAGKNVEIPPIPRDSQGFPLARGGSR